MLLEGVLFFRLLYFLLDLLLLFPRQLLLPLELLLKGENLSSGNVEAVRVAASFRVSVIARVGLAGTHFLQKWKGIQHHLLGQALALLLLRG